METGAAVEFHDRLLTCQDCGSEFIFTAGEQLFFFDKQFKNDPKRCKPCKSRRAGGSLKPGSGPAAAGISRTETRTHCSECGIETTVPFKPTQGRPVLCRQCFQVKAALPPLTPTLPHVQQPILTPTLFMDPTVSALTQASTNASGAALSQDAAVLAVTSMTSAAPNSSVATAADLASISGGSQGVHAAKSTEIKAAELLPASLEAPQA